MLGYIIGIGYEVIHWQGNNIIIPLMIKLMLLICDGRCKALREVALVCSLVSVANGMHCLRYLLRTVTF